MSEEDFDVSQNGTEEDEEFYEHHRITADKGQEPLRVDKFLMNRLENASRTKLQSAAAAGNIRVNDKQVKSNYKVKPGDVVTVVMAHPPREKDVQPENIPLNIVYEDDEVLVINKPAGLVVHPGYGNYTGTLVNGVMYHLRHLTLFKQGDPRPGLVHRLDKNTSGIMVLAKTEHSMSHLARQFFDRTTDRTYNALVWGDMKEEQGTITGNIGRSIRERKNMAVFEDETQGKHAVTHWKVLERFGYTTFIECKLETGRTHQIRVHMQYAGHPLFNDDTYGGNRILKGTTFTRYKQFIENCFSMMPRHALHAKSLGFTHPVTGERMFFDSDLAEDMQSVIDKWRNYISARPISED